MRSMAAAEITSTSNSALSPTLRYHSPSADSSVSGYNAAVRGRTSCVTSPDKRRGLSDVETTLNRSLRNENDLLRCQLNDLIAREKIRVDLQRLRQNRETDVSSMVHTATVQLKAEVDQLKGMLQSTSGQLLQALSEREQAKKQKEKVEQLLEETRQSSATQECHLSKRLESIEEAFRVGVSLAFSLAETVEAFQRHVLPTFKPSGFELAKSAYKALSDPKNEGKALIDQLTRLESGLGLLRVIVDAKNDTLVMIRGKLKLENEELKAELQIAHEAKQAGVQALKAIHTPMSDEMCTEKNIALRQELQSLQGLFHEEVSQLKAKVKMYESEEQHGQGRLLEVQKELGELQHKLTEVEASRASLETSLKEETSARSQLVSQLFALRKENEKSKAELETLKLSQKFLVRQPRSGRLPVEKMDLMNTVNQLLCELNKVKGEKVSLEEELKVQRLSTVRDRVKRTVTSRDVEMAAANKVGDTELASKLARARLQQLAFQDCSMSSPSSLEGAGITIKPDGSYSFELLSESPQLGMGGSKELKVLIHPSEMKSTMLLSCLQTTSENKYHG